MSTPAQRSFPCPACTAEIFIPYDLPPTSAPCPRCGTTITSPALEVAEAPVTILPAKKEIPAAAPRALAALPEPIAPAAVEPISKTPWFISILLLMLVAGGSAVFYQQYLKYSNARLEPAEPVPTVIPTNPFNWERQARDVLQSFLNARTLEEKSRYVIGGQETMQRVQPLWGKTLLDEEPVNVSDFAAINPDGNEDDDNPTYLLMYDRPPYYDIKKYFRPLVTMEVSMGLETLDPLFDSQTFPSHFEMPPLRIQVFLKQTDSGLLLDLDIYLQTRYNTFRTFVETAPAGERATFRLLAVQDLPLSRDSRMQRKIYRLTDPIHITDSYRAFTPQGSAAAERMSAIDWLNTSGKHNPLVAVTVVLQKLADGEILLEEQICWDYEGLGGKRGNQLQLQPLQHLIPREKPEPEPTTVPDP